MRRLCRVLARAVRPTPPMKQPPSPFALVCDWCDSRLEDPSRDEWAEYRELGFLPCTCGGQAHLSLSAVLL